SNGAVHSRSAERRTCTQRAASAERTKSAKSAEGAQRTRSAERTKSVKNAESAEHKQSAERNEQASMQFAKSNCNNFLSKDGNFLKHKKCTHKECEEKKSRREHPTALKAIGGELAVKANVAPPLPRLRPSPGQER